jgi:ACS family tartrate transporter-like MFS transporter
MTTATRAAPEALTPIVSDLERTTMRRVTLRLIPFLFVLYIFNYMDRENVGIAALQMNRDLQFSAAAYGFGSGVFFIGYFFFEVPSNLIMARIGARRWIARIMITWGLIASAMMFVRTPMQFYALRFALGLAEAGFFPGIIYYLSQWFPAAQRARAIARFMIAVPLAAVIGNPLGVALLELDGSLGLRGWQWLYLVEGIPSVFLGLAVLALLTDRIEDARWLSADQRAWLADRLRRDDDNSGAPHGLPPLAVLKLPVVWMFSVMYFFLLANSYGYGFWAPLIIRDELHASNFATGWILGGIAVIVAIFMLVTGSNSDRTGERWIHAGGTAALTSAGYVAAAFMPTPVLRIAGLALVIIAARAFLPPFWCLPTQFMRGTAAAAGIAVINSIGNLGGFAGPYLIGWFKEYTAGTTGAFLGLATMSLLAAVMCFVVKGRSFVRP